MSDTILSGETFAAVIGNVLQGMLIQQQTSAFVEVSLPDLLPVLANELAGYQMKVTFEIEKSED